MNIFWKLPKRVYQFQNFNFLTGLNLFDELTNSYEIQSKIIVTVEVDWIVLNKVYRFSR